MKHFYLGLLTLFLTSVLWSQQQAGDFKPKTGVNTLQKKQGTAKSTARPSKNSKETLKPVELKKGTVSQNKAVLFSETFGGGMGAWTTGGTNGSVWQYDTDGPNGEYSDPVTEIITSTTASDGFMIFDADLYNTALNPSYEDLYGTLTSPVIDLSSNLAVTLEFEQAYRWCCSGTFFPSIELSTDGFASEIYFADVSVVGDAVNSATGTASYKVSLTSYLAIAANPSNFQFRFVFDGVTNPTSHYFWQVDDISVYDSPTYDLELSNVYWGTDGFAVVPTYQVPSFLVSPITFYGAVGNNGAVTQTDVVFTASSASFTTSSAATSIDPSFTATIPTSPVTLGTALTTHTVSFVANSSNTDQLPADNTFPDLQINVNPNILAADDNVVNGTINQAGEAYETGNVFNIGANASLDGAQVQVSAIAVAGADIYAKVYEMPAGITDFSTPPILLGQSNPYTIQAGDLGFDVNIAFSSAFNLTAGKSYLLTIATDGNGGIDDGFVCRTGGVSQDYASPFYAPSVGSWQYTSNTPMVRMNLSQTVVTPTITSSDADNTVCNGQTVTLTSSSATGNTWSTGATTQSITVSASGNYTVTVSGVTSLATTVTVINPTAPTISASGATTFCNGGSVTLTSSVGSGIVWSTGATTASITVLSSGTYTVTRTISGCSATSTGMAINVLAAPPTPTISASGATTFCAGGSVILTSSAASGNTWSNGATTQSITVASSGSYTVTNTVSGCSSTSAVTNITVNANPSTPTVSASGATTFCSGQSITLTSSAASGNTWSTGETTQAITVTATGNYSVTQTISGCSATSTVTSVTVNTTPATPTISTSGATTFCSGSSVTLTSSSPTNNFWNTGATSQSITVSSAGNYGVTVSQSGCSASSTLTSVSVNTSPVISLGTSINPVACGSTTGSVQVNGSGTGNINWSGTASGVAPGNSLPYTITGLGAGSYAISFTDGNGCVSNTLTPSLSDPGAPAAPTISSSGSTTFCTGGSVILTSSSASGNTWSTGATTQSITVNTGGSFFVTNTVAGCSSTSTATTVVVNSLPTVNAGTYSAICQNAADVVLNAGSPAGGTYSGTGVSGGNFDPSVSTQSILYTYTDGNGCSNSSTTTISVLGLPTVNGGADQNICPGGAVTLNGSGAPTLSWDQGVVNGVSFNPASTATYTLTGIGANGCTNTDFVTVTVESLPVIAAGTLTSPSTCSTATGSIQITGSGAGTLSWTGTASGSQSVTLPATVSSLAAGTYTFTFTNTTGCVSNTITQSLSDPGAPATPTISASGATTFCSGGSVTLTSSSATGNTWSNGETTQSITVSASGSYTVAVTVSGCTANSAATNVTVNAFPTIALGSVANPSTCGTATGSIQVTGSGTGTLNWTGAASGSLSGVALPITISNLAAGSYAVTFNDGCPSNTLNSSLSDIGVTVPVITTSGGTTFCAGGSVTLTSSVASGITWSNGATSQSINVTASGSYSVTNTAGACTASSLPTSVTVNDLPTVSAGADEIICSGASVTLTAAASIGTITWDNGVVDGVSFVPGSTTTYTVTANDANGCSATDQVTVTVNNIPVISATPTNPTTCSGTNGSILVSGTGGGSLVWFGTASGTANGITLPFTISNLASGTYTVVFTSNSGCSSLSQSATLSDPGAPTAPTISAGGPTTFCSGGSVVLTSSATSGITWSTGETTASITVNSAGNYSVSLNVGGCVAVSTPTAVTVTALPVISLGSTTNPTTCASLTGTIQVNGSGTGTVSWTGTASGSQSGVTLPFVINGLGSGTYSITFDNGCSSNTISASITDPGAPATPFISSTGSTICDGQTVTLTSSVTSGIQWSTGETTASIDVTVSGDYFVTASAGACTSTSAIETVVVNALPTVTGGADQTVCAGDPVTLTAASSSAFAWDNGVVDGVAFTPSASTQYIVTATDGNGCVAKDTVDVIVNALPVITFDPVALVCVYDTPVAMTATPSGGTFSGTGVSGTDFDPAGLTNGTYTVNYMVTVSGCSATASQDIVVDSCLAISENEIALLHLYPNPTREQLNISGSQLIDFDFITVKDQLGRPVIKNEVIESEMHQLDLSALANGIYYVVITGEQKQQTYKIEILK